jgi:S1-C subfamily serine protease
VITRVAPGSAAQAAGLQPGDVVIELNGKAIADADSFFSAVTAVKSGKLLKMLVIRNGTTTFFALPKP